MACVRAYVWGLGPRFLIVYDLVVSGYIKSIRGSPFFRQEHKTYLCVASFVILELQPCDGSDKPAVST